MVRYRFPGDDTPLPEVDVALVMESTYPFLKGGVSAVVHDLISHNPDLTFGIIHIAWDSHSESEDLYGMPDNVVWVDMIYLSLADFREEFAAAVHRSASDNRRITRQLLSAVRDLENGDTAQLWQLYDDAINPLSRSWRLWSVLDSREFMDACMALLPEDDDTSLGQLFWLMRDFFTLAFALTDRIHPVAKVYHAHTTGYASLVAATAARQHSRKFFLTEHNLHVRDTVNALVEQRMDNRVTKTSWRDLPRTTFERAWAYWWCQLGVFLYPSIDYVTYLHPAAVREALALGMQHPAAEILPNGLDWEVFEDARQGRRAAVAEIESGRHPHWRFACIARIVPIKGVIELADIVAELRGRGYTDFTVDLLGPTEHDPDYYGRCASHIRQLGLEEIIRFRGTVKVRDELHLYDALLLTSFNEGQPIVVLEAMAAGLPTLGTDVGGMDMTVVLPLTDEEGQNIGPCGDLVKAGDIEGFADMAAKLMDSPTLYLTWRENAFARLRATFLMSQIMGRYNEIYRSLGAGIDAQMPVAVIPSGSVDIGIIVPPRVSTEAEPTPARRFQRLLAIACRREFVEAYPGQLRGLLGGGYQHRREVTG